MVVRQSTLLKADEVKEIKDILSQYNTVAIASLEKVRSAQLQKLRQKLEKSAYLRVIKNSLITRAVSETKDKVGLEKFEEYLNGPNLFLFTSLNPYKLVILLEKSRVKATAKAGDVAAFDVIVPAGNTGLPPGPIISQFTAVGLRTRIESGSVWVSKATMVVKEGEPINAQLASLLSKLGIKPVEAGLSLKVVYDNGLILTEEDLKLDIDAFRRSVVGGSPVCFQFVFGGGYYSSREHWFPSQACSSGSLQFSFEGGYSQQGYYSRSYKKG